MTDGLPDVGLICRDELSHNWDRTGDAGRVSDPILRAQGARLYRCYACTRDCGITKTKYYNGLGHYMPELSKRPQYTDPRYLMKGGVDQDQLGLFRLGQFGEAAPPKRKPSRRR